MSFSQNLTEISLAAGADLSSAQYTLVKVDSNGAAVACGDGERAAGILTNNPASGQVASVAVYGVCKCTAGGTVTAGGAVASDASGTIVNATTGDFTIGIALEGAASGELAAVLITHGDVSA